MRCFRTSCSQEGRNQDTYNDILSRLEGADVVGVMHVVHLFEDRRHAGEIVTLPQERDSQISLKLKKKTLSAHILHIQLYIYIAIVHVSAINIKTNADNVVVKDTFQL